MGILVLSKSVTAADSNGPNFAGLLTNTTQYAAPGGAKPGYLTPTTDPTFGTTITRISGTPGSAISGVSGGVWGDAVYHQYSKVNPWNCDESLFMVETNKEGGGTGQVILDGQTYAPLFEPVSPPSGSTAYYRLWHPTNPDLMYYLDDAVFGTWNVRTGAKVTIRTFTGYTTTSFGKGEGNLSRGGDHVVITGTIGGTVKSFKYTILTDTKGADIADPYDNVGISDAGTYVVFDDADTVYVCDASGSVLRTIAFNNISHYDFHTDQNGDEVIVGRANGVGTPGSGLCKIRLSDGTKTSLVPSWTSGSGGNGGYPSHTSARANIPYAFCDYDDNRSAWQPYEDEITMHSLAGDVVYRLCARHNGDNGGSEPTNYEIQSHPCPSPGGGRVAFVSTWDNVSGGTRRPGQIYVCDFR